MSDASGMPGSRLPRSPVVVAAALTLAAVTLGLLPWPGPVRTSSGWQVAHVPASLWGLVIGTAVACLGAGAVITQRVAGLSGRDPRMWAWVAVVLLAAAALVWNALYAAALSTADPGPVIPVFHWLFTFVPALLAGWLFTPRAPDQRRAVALGTGIVTVPLLGLSWALLDASGAVLADLGQALWDTAVFGVVPLAGGVALAGVMGASGPARPMGSA